MGSDDDLYLLASDAGYGFVARFADMTTDRKAGKSLVTVPKGAKTLLPHLVNNYEADRIAAVTSEGRLLVFPVSELPQLGKGKGVKIIGLKKDRMIDIAVLPPGGTLIVHSGKRYMKLPQSDLQYYEAKRALRGNKLPRGYQNVDRLEIETRA